MMSGQPRPEELDRVVCPLLGHAADLRHVPLLWSEQPDRPTSPRDLFVDDLALIKRLPRNDRAIAIFYCRYLSEHPDVDPEKLMRERYLAGPAVLFDHPCGSNRHSRRASKARQRNSLGREAEAVL
jgi:hypothetical protein